MDPEADDEGHVNPAGDITLDFKTPIDVFGFDVIDVEPLEGNLATVATFFMSGIAPISSGDLAHPVSGMPVAGGFSFGRVVITMGGSGAVDNLVLHGVPTPAAACVGLIGFALLGSCRATRVRRSAQK